MRDYAQLRPRFWIAGTGKELRGDREAREMACYLVSAPTSNLLGLYYLPIVTIAHELGYEGPDASAKVRAVIARLESRDFCRYDDPTEYVWVVNMCREQVGDDPKKTDNRVTGILREIRKHSKNPFYADFCAHYAAVFGVDFGAPCKPLASPLQAPPKGFDVPKLPAEGGGESGSGSGSGNGSRTRDARVGGVGSRFVPSDDDAPPGFSEPSRLERGRKVVADHATFAAAFERAAEDIGLTAAPSLKLSEQTAAAEHVAKLAAKRPEPRDRVAYLVARAALQAAQDAGKPGLVASLLRTVDPWAPAGGQGPYRGAAEPPPAPPVTKVFSDPIPGGGKPSLCPPEVAAELRKHTGGGA